MAPVARGAAPKLPLEPLQGPALVLVAIAISVANFMQTLDLTIANVAVPTIAGDLGVAPDMGTWMLTSFATPLAITLPLTGRLAQRFGQVRLFRVSVVLFVLTSILCGLAPNFESLLLFRALQGAASGPITALSQALLLAVFPAARRNVALSVWQTTTFVAPVLGPIAGGWITDNLSWPYIFYVNVPTGALVLLVLTRFLGRRDNPTRHLPVDFVGLLLLAAAFGSLQLMLDRGQNLDWFAAVEIRALAVLCVVSFVALVLWELTDAHPIVDLRLFADRGFTAGTIAVTVGFGVYYGALVLVPLWLQTEQGYTATWAGIATAPLGIAGIVIAPLIGRIQGRTDPRHLATVALVGWGAASFWRMGFNTDVTLGDIAANSLLMGAATAFSSPRSCRCRSPGCRAKGCRRRRACRMRCAGSAPASPPPSRRPISSGARAFTTHTSSIASRRSIRPPATGSPGSNMRACRRPARSRRSAARSTCKPTCSRSTISRSVACCCSAQPC